jgi:hypothetical protein
MIPVRCLATLSSSAMFSLLLNDTSLPDLRAIRHIYRQYLHKMPDIENDRRKSWALLLIIM